MEIEISIDATLKGLGLESERLQQKIKDGVAEVAYHLERKVVEKIDSNIPPPLKPATIKAKGSSIALIDTGELRREIMTQIEPGGLSAKVGVVGGRAPVAVIHEFGAPAANIPERSFLRSTANSEKSALKKIIADSLKH